jgi:Tfp pilus assembly protein PilX
MRSTELRSKGFTLIASLLMLLLLSGISIGLMMMVNTEGKVGNADLKNNTAYHNAEGGIEQMTSDLAAMFQTVQAPRPSDICALSAHQPYIQGVTWKDYQVQPASGCLAPLTNNYGQIQSGPNQGLWAQIIPVSMLATAAQAGGQEVSMMRSAQVALIPVFQFGVFSESDLAFFSGPNFDFAGRVHTNNDLYPEVGNAAQLVFHDKVSAYGNVVRAQLPNGFGTGANYAGTVLMPTASQGCDGARPACRPLGLTEGSVTGAGGKPPQSGQNGQWPTISLSNYNSKVVDGNYGNAGGTGAKNLSLPFVNGTAFPYEIIRRPPAGENAGSALGASREYNLAQIRVLLVDDPAELPGGAADANNVRLANVAGSNQFGIPTPVNAAAFPGNVAPALPAGSTYNTYFATGSTAIPDMSTCTAVPVAPFPGPVCPPVNTTAAATPLAFDWPFAPANPIGGASTLVPAGAPLLTAGAVPAPAVTMCPPGNLNVAPPAGCPAGNPPYPYEVTANLNNAATWNMIDGWLRVEYKNVAGNWIAVTNEWLRLGFARGTTPPTAPGNNSVNPTAILIFQQPADRNGDGGIDLNGQAPVCTLTGGNPVKCTRWNYGRPPEVVSDFLMSGAGSNSPYFGITNAATVNQSLSKINWYPINIYDTREGETRDVAAGNNSCAATGVMNAVELDVANLKKWLWGAPGYGVSGPNVDFLTQNGWVLYFSDRRGMLPNPNVVGTPKTGDSGLEDSINTGSAAGIPDGVLEPKAAGKKYSPEDVNQNGILDSYGAQNIGLGFYNAGVNVNRGAGGITSGLPNNPYLPRIAACLSTGRKNWVSGARHALKLVDGSLANVAAGGGVPLLTTNIGGFTVASENPVYIQGDYNSSPVDPTWAGGGDAPGHSATAVIADSVTLLSNAWSDLNSFANPTTVGNRNAVNTYYRLAIAGGKNMNFPKPGFGANDYGTDGGTHNFLRYLENWGGDSLNYKGSLVSLYYSTYLTGVFKCCTVVYSPPIRNYSFDADFALPAGLPPGTPLFRDVDTLGYRQVFATRTY